VSMCEESPRSMSIAALTERCMKELQNYGQGAPSDDRFGMELFYRALMQRNALAWEAVQHCFNDIMCRWIRNHPLRDVACRYDSEENYVALGFGRFWQAMVGKQNSSFQSLGAAMKYLRACLHASVIDTLRTYSRARVVGLPEPGGAGEPSCEDEYDSGELWQVISHLLPDARERRVAHLLYHCGLKPRAIVHFCYEEFHDVREIYNIRRNIVDRLRRNADYLRNQLGYDIFEE
jgi:hypothetical protein